MEINLSGGEKRRILAELKYRFKYDGGYWIPFRNVPIDKEYVVVSDEIALKLTDKIEAYLKEQSKHFYLTGEVGYIEPHKTWLQKVDSIDLNYGPVEFVYFDDSFDWLIYISHENTVTFCGEHLVKFIKENC
ncbi:MAG: hypothetical protein K2O41_05735 [Clostridia bacterium]|nr:hypothetical protein [Clostridia bacterium]